MTTRERLLKGGMNLTEIDREIKVREMLAEQLANDVHVSLIKDELEVLYRMRHNIEVVNRASKAPIDGDTA